MAKTQAIKRRLKSVGNTKQITKAMELVSAVKMRRSQEATFAARPYSQTADTILSELSHFLPNEHPLFVVRPVKRRLIILITSDRGLAGSYNSNVIKALVDALASEAIPTKLIVIGQQGAQFASTLEASELIGAYTYIPTAPTITDLRPIIDTALSLYTSETVDTVQLLYTHFISTIKQQVTLKTLLPISPAQLELPMGHKQDVRFEPAGPEILASVVPRFLEAQMFQAQLEALASEHSMRMMAMKNATDNANDLIEDLTLTFNSARQAAITQELAEITSGAEAMH